MFRFLKLPQMDLQAKISLVLVGVILPTFLIVTLAENAVTQPLLVEEVRQVGITSGKTLASEIMSRRLFQGPNPSAVLERVLQEFLYNQPSIIRLEIWEVDPSPLSEASGSKRLKLIASNIDEESESLRTVEVPSGQLDSILSSIESDEDGIRSWKISIPIENKVRDQPKGTRKVLGAIQMMVSLRLMDRISRSLWKSKAVAAVVSCFLLFLFLRFFLRKTIINERLLRAAESQNLQLSEKLHDAQRQLMNTEKLAVMGQLTASFAHEIGTPLNAMGGHLQLLEEELSDEQNQEMRSRLEIIQGQLAKIAGIVKNFLQSTAKPASQRQLVDINRVVEQTVGLVGPRAEALGVQIERALDRSLAPIRAVPVEIEQILLNLVNNSLDSLSVKQKVRGGALKLRLSSNLKRSGAGSWAVLEVYDTGEGISREDLQKVRRPFFTTKRPGEGTGLGLTICEQLANQYGGSLNLESREGSWTRVTLELPYERFQEST